MPVYIAQKAFYDGIASVPFALPILKTLPWILGLYLLKWFFGGARNHSERNMHSKVVMITVYPEFRSTIQGAESNGSREERLESVLKSPVSWLLAVPSSSSLHNNLLPTHS